MSRVTRNILYNGIGQGLSLALGFIAVRFVFRSLGGDALGLIYFSLTFSAALAVALQLGICETAVREVAFHAGRSPEYLARFIRTSSLFYWGAFLLLSLLAYALAPYLVLHWVKLDSLDVHTATVILRVLSISALLALPRGLFTALVSGLERMEIRNGIDVAGKALQQFGIFGILFFHGSVFQVAYWIAACCVAQLLAYLIVCTRFFPVQAMLPGFSLNVVKQNMRFASGLMTITLCAWVFTQADRVIISKLLPLTVLGLYSFARGTVGQGALLTGAINNAIFPHFSRLYAAGNTDEMKASYHKIHDLICFSTIPVFAAAPFAAIPLLSRVFDPPSAHMLLLPVTFLCLGYYMNGTLTTPYVVSLAVGRPDITARQNFHSLFVLLPVSVVAIYFLGLNGAGFSFVLYHVFYYLYGTPRICRECLGMRARVWHWHVLRILTGGILVYGSAWLAVSYAGALSILHLSIAYGGATIIYLSFAPFFMGQETRRRFLLSFDALRLKYRDAMASE
jgi:O-antigen/teichoic acid export membrane protein